MFTDEWTVSALRNTIGSHEIHVWAWSLVASATDPSQEIRLLDAQERERLARLRFVADRQRFATAHVTMRRILGAYLGLPAEDVRFRMGRFGKPELPHFDTSLCFNLSHSRTVAVMALGLGHPLGVDVEDIHAIEPEVAETHFSPAELLEMQTLEGDAWLTAFYRCWTRKEAILKGEGVGLQIPLDSFDVGLAAQAELLSSRYPFSRNWKLQHLAFCPGVIGALAVAQPDVRVSCFRL